MTPDRPKNGPQSPQHGPIPKKAQKGLKMTPKQPRHHPKMVQQ